MPLDTSGYDAFEIGLGPEDVETPQVLEVRVDPHENNGADVLCTYTGVLRFAAVGNSESEWRRGSLVVRIPTPGRRWSSISRGPEWTGFRGGAAVVSLASIFNAGVADSAGWAVDAAIVEPIAPSASPSRPTTCVSRRSSPSATPVVSSSASHTRSRLSAPYKPDGGLRRPSAARRAGLEVRSMRRDDDVEPVPA